MAKWYHYSVTFPRGVPPLRKHLDVINRRLRALDWDALELGETGFNGHYNESPRWRSPLVTPEDVVRIVEEVSGMRVDVTRRVCVADLADCDICAQWYAKQK